MSIHEARKHIRALLDDSSPAESPTAYYALFHPGEKSTLTTYSNDQGRALAFAGRFQTGLDLFRPLLTLKAPQPEIAAYLLGQLLVVGRPYILFAGLSQLAMVGGSLQIDNQRLARIYTIDPSRFQPQINVLVQRKTAHDGTPRSEIKSGEQAWATAGLSWKSPAFAEIYLQTNSVGRQKGWDRLVMADLTTTLLKTGLRAVYLVENGDETTRLMVESLGYVDTGSRQVYADTIYLGNPTR